MNEKELLEKLEELDIKDQFMANLINFRDTKFKLSDFYTLRAGTNSFQEIVECAFSWEQTPEGHNFWYNISKQ